MTIEARMRQVDQLLPGSSVSLSSYQQSDIDLAYDLCKQLKLHFGTLIRRASAIARLADTGSVADRLREAAQHLIFTAERPDAIRAAVNNVLSLSAGSTTAQFCTALNALPKRLGCVVEQSDDESVLVQFDGNEYRSRTYRSLFTFKRIVLMNLTSLIQMRRPAWAVHHCPTTWFRQPIDSTDYIPDFLLSASWQSMTRVCPRCEFAFDSSFDSGQCEACGAYFLASDIYGPHSTFDLEQMLRDEAVDYPNFYELDVKRLEELPPMSDGLRDEQRWCEQFFRRRIVKALDEGAELYYWQEWCDIWEVDFHWLFAVKYCRITERVRFQPAGAA